MKSATVASPLSVHISKTFRKIKYIVFSCQRCQHREHREHCKHRQPHQHCQHGQHCWRHQRCQRHQNCHCHLVLTTSTGLATRVAVTPATAALAKWHLNLVVIRGYHVSWLSSSWLSGWGWCRLPVNKVARGDKTILDGVVDNCFCDVDDAVATNVREGSWWS